MYIYILWFLNSNAKPTIKIRLSRFKNYWDRKRSFISLKAAESVAPEQVDNTPAVVEDSPPAPAANSADPAPAAEDPPLDDLVPAPAQQDTDSLR